MLSAFFGAFPWFHEASATLRRLKEPHTAKTVHWKTFKLARTQQATRRRTATDHEHKNNQKNKSAATPADHHDLGLETSRHDTPRETMKTTERETERRPQKKKNAQVSGSCSFLRVLAGSTNSGCRAGRRVWNHLWRLGSRDRLAEVLADFTPSSFEAKGVRDEWYV